MKTKIAFCGAIAAIMCLTSCGQDTKKNTKEKQALNLNHGGVSSNGGASLLDADNPWFLGDQPVPYCIETGTMFSVGKSDLENIVKESLDDWTTTIKVLKGHKSTYAFPDGRERGMAVNFTLQETCNEDTRLTFSFGTDRKPEWGNGYGKIGEAIRTPINLDSGHTTGTVWISPDQGEEKLLKECDAYWSQLDQNPLANIVMHELGHVFGLTHNTMPFAHFMNEDAPGKILSWLGDVCQGDIPQTPNERVSSKLFSDRLAFFSGNPHLGNVIDKDSWLKDQLGFKPCQDQYASGLSVETLTKANKNVDRQTTDLQTQSTIFEKGTFKVDLAFRYCGDSQKARATFLPDPATRFHQLALVTGHYTHQQATDQWHPPAEYVIVPGEYGASGTIMLENGKKWGVYLEAKSNTDRFLQMTFQSAGSPHVEVLLQKRIVYGFANVAYRTE